MSIKHETIEIAGTVMYCDGCGRKGPIAAYDNPDEVIDCAQEGGWTNDDKDLCPDCIKKPAKKRSR